MPSYFEKQVGRGCALHALNNALQMQFIRLRDVQSTINEMVEDKELSAKRRGKRFNSQSFRRALLSRNRGCSPDVIQRFARKHGWYFHLINDDATVLKNNRRYYIQGNKQYGKQRFRHAIALVNGRVLDSEEDEPLLGLPEDFQVEAVYEINRKPPRQVKERTFIEIDLESPEPQLRSKSPQARKR